MTTRRPFDRSGGAAFTRPMPLPSAVLLALALAAPSGVCATTWPVTSCADSGPGSLRDIVNSPTTVSGDTVDLSQLNSVNCPSSTISLTTGAIGIFVPTLTLTGPPSRITITGYYNGAYQNDILIDHGTSGGTLYLNNLNFEYSNPLPASGARKGGCIYSAGSVNLTDVTVFQCHARGKTASGGGIFALNNLTMKYSQITANSASTTSAGGSYRPRGGGVYVEGALSASFSTISNNSAPNGYAGGIDGFSGATITNSTVSGNDALFDGAMKVVGSSNELKIVNSTISGNSAASLYGGIVAAVGSVTIQNSTIAFNTSFNGFPNQAPGLFIFNPNAGNESVDIESSILSNNTYGSGMENDFSAGLSAGATFTITSHNSIVRASAGNYRPATVTTACPLLGSLRLNGGTTLTHALLSGSPAIDAGNNSANLATDQRGGPFGTGPARVSGPAADIGAYEVQQSDIIFNASFDGCPILQ